MRAYMENRIRKANVEEWKDFMITIDSLGYTVIISSKKQVPFTGDCYYTLL